MSSCEFHTTVTPSLNTWQRMHRFAKPRVRKDFAWQCLTCRPLTWPSPPPAFAVVEIVRYGRKLLDRDNLYGGAKPLIDGLKDAGFIRDDSPAHIKLTIRQERTVFEARTRIRVSC